MKGIFILQYAISKELLKLNCPLTYHSYGSYLSGHEYRQRYCTNVFLSCFMQNVNYEKLMKLRWEMSFSLHSPSTDLPMTLVREQQS